MKAIKAQDLISEFRSRLDQKNYQYLVQFNKFYLFDAGNVLMDRSIFTVQS